MRPKVNEVFIPGAFPKYTYVSRESEEYEETYESRLRYCLNTAGFLTSIVGPSKTGKTVLCEKVIGLPKVVSLTGNDFKDAEDFWITLAKKVRLPLGTAFVHQESLEGEGLAGTKEARTASRSESYGSNKDEVINFFKNNDLVLVIDDFHYATENMQYEIAYQLKDAIRYSFKAIVISLPHRSDDAIRKNGDLSGRLNLVNIEPWTPDELKEIAITGFEELGVTINDSLVTSMAQESLSSPQLMQSNCLNLGLLREDDPNIDLETLNVEILNKTYKRTSLNHLTYQEVARKIKAGPYTRGKTRKSYTTIHNGITADIYELVVKAIAVDPPTVRLSTDEMKQRIDSLIEKAEDKPERKKIVNTIQQIQNIINTSEQMYQVFEYKDEQIYILEPLFLFYLRWGKL
ncbi:hypothetical protein DFQ01_11056 [Paenibacillus cellulosilyticus]|uniref:AAA domain-containing protein n=1 Tax=Paenibacillus cellulosilyticus TaxID=375489 RepID=A0A2V2YTK4_9BACL|nr:hypothetical protein [Paenibacillus cellulosilyticus]PWW01166.1 hypothetical protein DFQ01_11056 [Paenibacillus cellulosilyticus]QKS46873.1 ATP-binding protein [Paenibacillus cellulosilyticus]